MYGVRDQPIYTVLPAVLSSPIWLVGVVKLTNNTRTRGFSVIKGMAQIKLVIGTGQTSFRGEMAKLRH